MSLRDQLIEAAVEAMRAQARRYESGGWVTGNHDNAARAALDAILDTLEANADETIHALYNDMADPWRLADVAVEDLVAALREDTSGSL